MAYPGAFSPSSSTSSSSPPAAAATGAAAAADAHIATVLEFWLGAPEPTDASSLARQSLWFTKSDALDSEIRNRFGDWVRDARAGRLDGWAATSHGRLALVVLLDQFSRNAWRGQPESFAGDAKALALALQAQDNGHWEAVAPLARFFLALPLEHAEDPALQARSVALFTQLAAQATPETRPVLSSALDYAHQHQDVVARFGRFPHRNAVLGRASTEEEKAYLAQPGAGF